MRPTLTRRYQSVTERLFPERQIFFRSRGDVRFIALSRRRQMAIAFGLLIAMSWIGCASYDALFPNEAIATRDRRVAELSSAYDQLALEYSQNQEKFVSASRDLTEKYRQLHELAIQHGLLQDLSSATGDPNQITGAIDQALSNRTDLEKQVAELQTRLTAVQSVNRTLVSSFEDRTASSVGRIEKIIKSTGVDLEALVRQALQALRTRPGESPVDSHEPGRGGPFIALVSANSTPATGKPGRPTEKASLRSDEQRSQYLQQQLNRWAGLQLLLLRMPLGQPVEEGEIGSPFGRRTDPVTGQLAFHSGMDITGQRGTPVSATAAGTVVNVELKGPYGRMVEIDHGMGFKTRYAHLNEILVKPGESVGAHQAIGKMGSTGRSTGVHLHYEVLYHDEPQDPANFLEAGTHVFVQQENTARHQ